MLNRSRAAVRRVTYAVESAGSRPTPGAIPPGRDVAELVANVGLPGFTVKYVELLIHLHKEIITMVNKSVLMGPLSAWHRWYVRRELRKAVKSLEQSASNILEGIGKLSR